MGGAESADETVRVDGFGEGVHALLDIGGDVAFFESGDDVVDVAFRHIVRLGVGAELAPVVFEILIRDVADKITGAGGVGAEESEVVGDQAAHAGFGAIEGGDEFGIGELDDAIGPLGLPDERRFRQRDATEESAAGLWDALGDGLHLVRGAVDADGGETELGEGADAALVILVGGLDLILDGLRGFAELAGEGFEFLVVGREEKFPGVDYGKNTAALAVIGGGPLEKRVKLALDTRLQRVLEQGDFGETTAQGGLAGEHGLKRGLESLARAAGGEDAERRTGAFDLGALRGGLAERVVDGFAAEMKVGLILQQGDRRIGQ